MGEAQAGWRAKAVCGGQKRGKGKNALLPPYCLCLGPLGSRHQDGIRNARHLLGDKKKKREKEQEAERRPSQDASLTP